MLKKNHPPQEASLLHKIADLLTQARQSVVSHINTTMVQTYWTIGKHIVEFEQGGAERATYGTGLLQRLSKELTIQFGKGFSERMLQKCRQFFLTFPDFAHTAGGIQNLGRSHITRILHLKDPGEQAFFMIETAKKGRSLRELDRQINSALYQRLALSRSKEGVLKLAQKGQLVEKPEDTMKDPVVLEFLGLQPCRERDDIALKYTLNPEQKNIFAKEYQLYLPTKEQIQHFRDMIAQKS